MLRMRLELLIWRQRLNMLKQKTVGAALNIINGELVDLGLPINVEKSAALLICPSARKEIIYQVRLPSYFAELQ